MTPYRALGPAAACALLVLAACAEPESTTAPEGQVLAPAMAKEADDPPAVSAELAALDAKLAAAGSRYRVAKAEFILYHEDLQPNAVTTIIANDRARGIGIEWVARDPRRDGRVGVTYAIDPAQRHTDPVFGFRPVTRNPDGSGLRPLTFAELEAQLEAGQGSWRDRTCSDAPVDRVAVPAGVDPDLLDELFVTGAPSPNYLQVSDVVQGGWQPNSFFTAFAGASGSNIIGVAFSFWYVDDNGDPTDIDGDGNRDTGLVEIYYNTRFAWGSTGAANVVDLYSIIAHETGHSFGLAHFGKVFLDTKGNLKRAPTALMNAVYVGGQETIRGTDNSSFCQIWASKN